MNKEETFQDHVEHDYRGRTIPKWLINIGEGMSHMADMIGTNAKAIEKQSGGDDKAAEKALKEATSGIEKLTTANEKLVKEVKELKARCHVIVSESKELSHPKVNEAVKKKLAS